MRVIFEVPTFNGLVAEDEFIPFEGNTDLERFVDANTGEELFFSANGDCFYNAKGEKKKGFFKKIGKGIVKGVKAVGRAIKKASRWVAKKSKKLVGGAKKGGKVKPKGKKLKHVKTSGTGGKDVFRQELAPATASTPPAKTITIEGKKFSTENVPPSKPIVVATDPTTGMKTVGVEFAPSEVAGVQSPDGTYEYYKTSDVEPPKKGMSKALTIGLIVGGVVVAGIVTYLIVKKNKK
jgi:hypothetical protein